MIKYGTRVGIVFLSLLATLTSGVQFQCDPDTTWNNYRFPMSDSYPVQFNGTETAPDTGNSLVSRCFIADGITCGGASDEIGGRLADRDLGSEELNISAVNAWNRNFSIVFELRQETAVTAINLYFYNIPSMGIGLPPSIELYYGIGADTPNQIRNYIILNNEDFSQEDDTRRNVTLVVTASSIQAYRYLRIDFGFGDSHPIDWLLLTEVQFCIGTLPVTLPSLDTPLLTNNSNVTIPLGPVDNLVSNITLSCSVANEGRFQWVWTFPSVGVQYQQLDTDATRTSIVEISGINFLGGYNGEYRCQAMYHPDVLPNDPNLVSTMTARVFDVSLRSNLTASHRVLRYTILDKFVSISCEISGYVQRQDISVTWQYENSRIESGGPYQITVEDGSGTIVDGPGSTRPSIRSILTVAVDTGAMVEGGYLCSTGIIVRQITLDEDSLPPTTLTATSTQTTTFDQPTTTSPSQSSFSVILGATISVLGIFLILTSVVIIILVVIICRNKRHQQLYEIRDPVYETVDNHSRLPLDYETSASSEQFMEMKTNTSYGSARNRPNEARVSNNGRTNSRLPLDYETPVSSEQFMIEMKTNTSYGSARNRPNEDINSGLYDNDTTDPDTKHDYEIPNLDSSTQASDNQEVSTENAQDNISDHHANGANISSEMNIEMETNMAHAQSMQTRVNGSS